MPGTAALSRPRGHLSGSVASFVRRDLGRSLLAIAVGAVLWQLLATALHAAWLPSFSAVVSQSLPLLAKQGFRGALLGSLENLAVGYLVAVVLGVSSGVAMGLSRMVDSALKHYLNLLLCVPPIVTAPIFLIIFGLSKATLLAIIVVFSATAIAVNCRVAVLKTEPQLREVASVFGATGVQAIQLVVLPGALPLIFAGLHLGMGRAVKGLIIGQLFLAVVGLGAFEARFQQAFDATGLWCIALVVVVISLILSWAVKLLDGIVNYWAYGG